MLSKSKLNDPSERGKWAEREVIKFFDDQSHRFASFNYERLPDARAARGRFKAMVADFDIGTPGVAAFVEVKCTQHPYRISRDKVPQLARLRKWVLSGRGFVVVVYHSERDKWRLVPDTFFGLEGTPASWDLRSLPEYPSAEAALKSTGWFR